MRGNPPRAVRVPRVRVEAYEYRTHCRSGHRAGRRRRRRLSRERLRQQARARRSRSRNCRRSRCSSPNPTSVSARPSSPRICNGRPGRNRPQAAPSSAATIGPTRRTRSPARSHARPFIAGEPIREQKLVKADGSGFMAAILPTGMRAISTEISPETGAGGFILPNDRVDVILTKREKNPDDARPAGRRQLRDHPVQHPRARDRPGAEGKGRPERRWSAGPSRWS